MYRGKLDNKQKNGGYLLNLIILYCYIEQSKKNNREVGI